MLPVRSHHLELHLAAAGHGAPGALDHQGHVAISVGDLEPLENSVNCFSNRDHNLLSLGLDAGPLLPDVPDDLSWRGADLQLMEAAREEAGVAAERSAWRRGR